MISINILLLALIVIASFYAWNKQGVMNKWIMNPYTVRTENQWYRFITSGLIHNDYMHLAFNVITLYFFGGSVEYVYSLGVLGKFGYVLFFILGIVVSDIPTYLKNKNNPSYSALGASGGVSAVVFASVFLFPADKLTNMMFPVPMPAFVFGALYLIYSHYMSKKSIDNINHDAHLYGALFGILFTLIYVKGAFLQYFLNGPRGIMNMGGLF